jgi:hypothetical protein
VIQILRPEALYSILKKSSLKDEIEKKKSITQKDISLKKMTIKIINDG